MRNIVIERSDQIPMEEREIEIVERKGIGHPDTICDGCSEAASQALSQYYFKNFGAVLHHNLDKGLLIAGRSQPKFGGGKILEPIKIIVAGRATDRVGKTKIPVKEIGEKAIKKWLKKNLNLREKEIEEYFKILIDYQPGAANLRQIFKGKVALANDSSFGVGFSPLSQTEKLTLKLSNFINSKEFERKFPFVGKDIKVLSFRKLKDVFLTISTPFIDKYVKSLNHHFQLRKKVKRAIEDYFKKNFDLNLAKLDITFDNPKAKDESQIYLTVLGLSAEQGDDGQVGRGNRVCGLITPCREMSLEAAAGKNINHPGKLYQILAYLIAQEIGKIQKVRECSVKILSQIGKPLDQPQLVFVKMIAENFEIAKDKASKIINRFFDNLLKIQQNIIKGKYQIF